MARRKSIFNPDEDLESLETHLAGTLKRIQPPREVVHRLRDRIHFPAREEIASRLHNWTRMFVVFGSVMSGMLIVITIARALYYLAGRKSG